MSDNSSKRSQRVAHLLKEELARLIDSVGDPRIGFVTVTEVRPAPDLKSAKVFVSIYGDEEKRVATVNALSESAGYLRREMSKRVRMKYVPRFVFLRDDSLDRAERLESLLTAINDGELEIPEEHAVAPVPVSTDRTEFEARRQVLNEEQKQRRKSARGGKKRGTRRGATRRR